VRIAQLAFAIACIAIGFFLGERYISRLPDHAGYFLVAVADQIRAALPSRPRHTAFIVVDGLRRDAAEGMTVTRLLEKAGQCRVSDQGSFTVSRPEYALLSTGLEVDRTGSRNNDLTAPLAAESIWQVARASGLRVSGSSHLPWFQQLFPGGFDRFTHLEAHSANVFAEENGALLDVNLFHPLYVDENAHHHGVASSEYAAAVARVDLEIAGLLERIDLTQDLVVLTADHGHRDAGGHGGAQPEIRNVLICFAGRGVARRSGRAAFDGRSTAPALALLLGVPFPRHMRAGDDGLDALWEIATSEPSVSSEPTERSKPSNAAYLADRRAAVEHFRNENRRALEAWLGDAPGTWPRLYAREAGAQDGRAALLSILTVLGFAAIFRARRLTLRETLAALLWMAAALLALWVVHRIVLGDLDFTVINLREQFIPRAALVTFSAALAATAGHVLALRRPYLLAGDLLLLVFLLLVANVGHVYVYGWPLGFPLPGQAARYFPFLGAIALATYALVAAVVIVRDAAIDARGAR
jgi:hypothetical protein